jgi:hypothetical protein
MSKCDRNKRVKGSGLIHPAKSKNDEQCALSVQALKVVKRMIQRLSPLLDGINGPGYLITWSCYFHK